MRRSRSPAEALLASAIRAFLEGEPAGATLAAGSPDWEGVLRRAEVERLAPLLYTVVGSLSLPAAVLDRLRAGWVSARRQYLLGVEQLCCVLAEFEREGVAVLTLKGPALAEALYPDPGLRPFTDLDLLVRAADVQRAVSLLSALGYRHQDPGHSLEYDLAWRHSARFASAESPADLVPVDLHWGLLDYPGIARGPSMDLEEVWERAVKVGAWSPAARGLCPEDLLIYLALHWAVHHAFSGALWGLDLALLLRRQGGELDWEAVAERGSRWGIRGGLYFALREIEEQFAVGPPAAVLLRLRPRGLRLAALEWLRRRGREELERLDYLVPVLLMDRAPDVLRALAGAALPPAGWARFRYGKDSPLGAYLTHYGRIGRVCLRTVRAALAR